MHLIETQHLSFAYRDSVRALDDVNFVAPRNAKIAVIGPNGAGKSTLFRHLNGIELAQDGQVLVRGEAVTKNNIKEVRKFVGVVFQNPDDQIFAPTVEQDVAFGPTNLGLDEATVMHRVDEALGLLGIAYLRHRAPHHLSGGEKKRVAIAGVLAMEPGVLVMDEPTAGLDPRGRDDLIGFVNGLSEDYGMTVIISTHELDLVTEFADYVYVMDRGAIQAQGTVAEIFEQEELLRRVRLDVPVLPKLCRSLRRRGADLPMAYTYDEVETEPRRRPEGASLVHDRRSLRHRAARIRRQPRSPARRPGQDRGQFQRDRRARRVSPWRGDIPARPRLRRAPRGPRRSLEGSGSDLPLPDARRSCRSASRSSSSRSSSRPFRRSTRPSSPRCHSGS